MKNLIVLTLITFFLVGCRKQITIFDAQKLNGYWQIKKVKNSDGQIKDYPINEIYDFFEIKNKIGFHKKVLWQPTGIFLVNDAVDSLIIINNQENIKIKFKTKIASHTEEIIEISDKNFVLQSISGTKFYYEKVILNSK